MGSLSRAYSAPELTSRQVEMLAFIRYFWQRKGTSPSIRDFLGVAAITSTSVVVDNLTKLEAAGHIRRSRELARCITLTGDDATSLLRELYEETQDFISPELGCRLRAFLEVGPMGGARPEDR